MFFKDLGNFGSYNYDLFIILGFGSFGVLSILLAGIFSNNKFALYGALRAVIQMISYELVLLLTILPILSVVGSGTLVDILYMQNLCHISFG